MSEKIQGKLQVRMISINNQETITANIELEGRNSFQHLNNYQFGNVEHHDKPCEAIIENGTVIQLFIDGQEIPNIPEPIQQSAGSQQCPTKTIDQYAYQCAYEHKNEDKYSEQVKSVPMLIKTNGLGATVMFLRHGDNTSNKIHNDIEGWFKQAYPELIKQEDELWDKIPKLDSQQTKALTKEAMLFLSGLRRYAEGMDTSET